MAAGTWSASATVGVPVRATASPKPKIAWHLGRAFPTPPKGSNDMTAELFHRGGHFAGGDTLDIEFGQSQLEGLVAADAFFESVGIEVRIAAHLRDLELDRADAGGERLGFEVVGVTLAGVGAFAGLGLKRASTFLAHGFIDEEADALGEAASAFFIGELEDGIQ